MGIKYSFVDNEIYGTEDINEIAQCLTGAGVMPFLTKESYSTSDLNSVAAALVSDGASLDGCKCTVKNAGTADMSIKVAQGIIFFESGVRLIIDSAGYSVEVLPNTAGYVLAHYSPSLQRADIVFAEELPADGEYVELAQLDEYGSCEDLRVFARSKVATMGSSVACQISQERMQTFGNGAGAAYGESGQVLAEIDLSGIDISRYKYLLYKYSGWSYNNAVSELFERHIDWENFTDAVFPILGTTYYGSSLLKFTLEGSKLIFYTTASVNDKIYKYILGDFTSAMPYFMFV